MHRRFIIAYLVLGIIGGKSFGVGSDSEETTYKEFSEDKDDILGEDEEGIIKEDLSTFTKEGEILYKVMWRPRDCDGPTKDGDDVEMNMEYFGINKEGEEVEMEHALTNKIGHGQTVRTKGSGLLGMCLGERRKLLVPQKILQNKYKNVLPGLLDTVDTYLEVEVVRINKMWWDKLPSGLHLAMLEPVKPAYCARTVEDGDTLAVEYEGSLESGEIFDSSKTRGAPFGPFVHGRGQIIEGYTQVLGGRCLGERWRMTVPPHLAYGDRGVGDDIPGGATLTFDVRLVRINDLVWSDEVRNKKVYGWEEVYKPEVCEFMAGYEDDLTIHYSATREDGSKFGSIDDGQPPYGPFRLDGDGTFVPGLDFALPGMCLGERRNISVPPRMGWKGTHHDTIQVEVFLVTINGHDAPKIPDRQEL